MLNYTNAKVMLGNAEQCQAILSNITLILYINYLGFEAILLWTTDNNNNNKNKQHKEDARKAVR